VTVAVVVWGDPGGVTDSLERLRGTVTVVRQCGELTEVVALAESGLADAALLAGDSAEVDGATLDALSRLGVPALVLAGERTESDRLSALGASVESPASSAQSISDLLELLCNSVVRGAMAPIVDATARQPTSEREPGRVMVVWGAPGAPGRTTIAVNAAVEAALDNQDVVLLDADTYGASVAVHLGLLDESAGIAQLCRLADQGVLDRAGFDRACSVLAVAGTRIRVATGLPRASRWPELRTESMTRVLDFARRQADLVVVDVAPFIEFDEDLTFDTSAPQRNAAAAAALEAADDVLAVAAADSVGVPRLVKAVEELADRFPDVGPRVVFNKVRSSSIGSAPERQLRESWIRFGPDVPVAGFVPWDRETADAALLAGSVLAESAPATALRASIAGLVGVGITRRRPLFRR